MWSRIDFQSKQNITLVWKSRDIYKIWKLLKIKWLQDITWVWWKKYWDDYYSTEIAILENDRDDKFLDRVRSELMIYENLIIQWLLESIIFEIIEKDPNSDFFWINKWNDWGIFISQDKILSWNYDDELLARIIEENKQLLYIKIYFKINESVSRQTLEFYSTNSKNDGTIIYSWDQLIMFKKQLEYVLCLLNKNFQDSWLRRFDFDCSKFDLNTDWFSCLLYLEIQEIIYIEHNTPEILSTDIVNLRYYIKIRNQEKFEELVRWIKDLNLLENKLIQNTDVSQKKIENFLILDMWSNYIDTYYEKNVRIPGKIPMSILKRFFDKKSESISLSKSMYKLTEEAFNKMLVRLRKSLIIWWLKLEKVPWKDQFLLKKM